MKHKQWLFPGLTLGMMVGAALFLLYWKSFQKLGEPGVHVVELSDEGELDIGFPATVLDYQGQVREVDPGIVGELPEDTTIDIRWYRSADGFELQLTGVLMGSDRTSIHQPEFCLTGVGFNITDSTLDTIKIGADDGYELPVMVLRAEKEVNGINFVGFYIYWFVADGLATAEHWERMWWMAKGLFTEGELQRWAYVSCFGVSEPGQREAIALERMKSFLVSAIPEFQPRPAMLSGAGRSNREETALLRVPETENK